ncbi:RHS repeat-associated core domain-containing protein [Streptomyces albipurpureus]|uniref:Polymorphic toxin-type HINT domain-containing protein n=1 Tax=Streptomyces albipurpureus TaxID=2897419 RepID=A0ABT0UYL9_9ACTN|nr:RHS repeat-associated core domain-containing protein [Streptomyces sp. CWNU-1]MCM2392740.1 polymorphic toxin-type HINT domain-containing protein [Streptomyces sp. CWNU-1]
MYAYDAAGRLVGVTDPAGETARYRYDEAGNRLGIDRFVSSQLAVLSLVPLRAAVGAIVTLSGTGFSVTAASNTITFGTTTAEVVDASATRLRVKVPADAAAGNVSVTVGGVTAQSTESFTLAPSGPTVASFTPASGTVDTPVVVSGTGFAPGVTDNVVRFGGGIVAEVVTRTVTALTVKVPPGAVNGPIVVETPDGRAVSTTPFQATPAPGGRLESSEFTSATDETPPRISVSTVGNFSEVRFEADQGETVAFGFTQSTFSGQVTARLIDPQGVQIGNASLLGIQDSAEWGYTNLPVSGQYTLTVSPVGNSTGAVTVAVSQPVVAELDPAAPPTAVTISRPGQNGIARFTAQAGQKVSLGVTTTGFSSHNTLTLRRPDGTTLTTLIVPNNGPEEWDSSALPTTGTYAIAIAPNGVSTGTVTLTLSQPASAGTLATSADPIPVEVTRAGQNAEASFLAAAGADLSLAITSNAFTSTVYASVIAPSGSTVVNRQFVGSGAPTTIGLSDLPATGSYSVVLDPYQGSTGSLALSVSEDNLIPIAPDGPSASATITRPGQRLRAEFTAPQTKSLGFAVTGNSIAQATEVYLRPEGGTSTRVGTVSPLTDGVANLTGLTPGTKYAVLLVPSRTATGNLTLWLSTPAAAGTLSASLPSGTGQTSRPGQELQFTVEVAAGDGVAVRFTNSSLGGNISLITPGGTVQPQVAWLSTGTGEVDLRAPLLAGLWTVLVQPTQGATGAVTGTRISDAMGPGLVVNGVKQQVTVTSAAQNGQFTFSGTQGQQLTLTADAPPFGWYLSVYGPDNKWLVNGRYLSASTLSTNLGTLPANGVYTVTVDPDAQAVGTISLGVKTTGTARSQVAASASGTMQATHEPTSPGAVPTGRDAWKPDKANLRGSDWITRRPGAPKAPPRLRAPPGITALTGRVLRLDGTALPKVTVSAGTKATRTDSKGRFLLAGISPDTTTVVVNGASANTTQRTWGRFDIRVHPASGRSVDLGFPVWMTPLDTRHTLRFDSPTSADLILRTPAIPGLEVHLPTGSVVRDEKGNPVNELGITAIPLDRPPFPLPDNRVVPVYFTVQPGGTYVFPKGAQIIYPNYTREAPGTRVEFMDYDPKKRGWYVYGHGQVSADGRQVIPDPKTRVWSFHGAMFNIASLVPWDLSWSSDVLDWLSGDPVELSTGMLTESRTDLAVADTRGSIDATRAYWQADTRKRAFGIGRDLAYNAFLNSKNSWQEVDLYLPGGGKVHFVRTSAGTGYRDAVLEPTDVPSEFRGSKISYTNNGWELRFRDGAVWVFPQYAPLKQIRDRHGNTTIIVRRDGNRGDVTRVVSPSGRWISFGYDTEHRVTEATDNTGRTTGYSYDTAGRLATVIDPAGKPSTYTYDGTSNRIKNASDARGITYMTNTFYPDGRVKDQTLTEGATYNFAYTQTGMAQITSTTVTQPGGSVRRVEFDTSGYGIKDTQAHGSPLARTTEFERGSYHRINAVKDPYGRRTELTYDANGHVTQTTQLAGTPQARTTGTAVYSGPYDQPTTLTDALGNATTLTYGTDGNLEKITDPRGRVTTYQHNPQGQIRTITDASGAVTEYLYSNGDLAGVKDAEGRVSNQFTDAAGRPTAFTDTAGARSTFSFDKLNQPRAVTDPLGHQITFAYDDNGNLTTLTDARNNATNWTYDNADRPKRVTDPLGAQTLLEYDPADRPTKTTNRSGQVTTAEYDILGRLKTAKYGIDATGQPQSTATYEYNTVDLPNSLTNTQAGNQTFAYDVYDRLRSVTGPTGIVSYAYDTADRRTEMTAAGITTLYGYDTSSVLTSITSGSQNITFGLDAVGRAQSTSLPGSLTRSTGYDKTGAITSIGYAHNSTQVGTLNYTRDIRGLPTGLTGSLASIALPAAETGATYGQDNRITAFGGRSFTYDTDGQLTDDGIRTYTWNARGQMTGLTKTGSPASSFAYDPLGIRSTATLNGTTKKFLTDTFNPLVEQTATGQTAAAVTASGLDQYLSRTENGQTQLYLTDALGSVVALANADGTIATRYTYDPYGQPTTTGAASTNPYTFTGRENDDTGLLYYRNRYYDPQTGRFISQDPIGHAGGPNLYQYALSSPTTYTDPMGNSPLIAACAIGGLIDGGLDWLGQRLSGRKVNWGQVGRASAMGCALGMVGAGVGGMLKPCRNSFTGDTPVLMADGSRKPIKDVTIGDQVASADPETDTAGPRRVTALIRGSGPKPSVRLTIDTDGTLGKSTGQLTATTDHPLWVPELRTWLPAGKLQPGQWVQTGAGTHVQITAISHGIQRQTVYNLTVDDLHTYYVLAGAASVLVHNCGNGYQWARPNAPTHVLHPSEAWRPGQGIPVIGRLPDTGVGGSWPGYRRLVVQNDEWSIAKNDAWIQTIINQSGTVYVGSPTRGTYWNIRRQEPTVFAREIQQLLQSGYSWRGNYLIPPTR